jgi:ABC-type branched-subunit amino acid transport system ATPase component/ABC-type branched-subunit amino acid transport system permease subunit
MVLAVLQNLVISYLPLAQTLTGLSATVPFILLLVAIWFLGRARGRQAGSAAESRPFREYMDDLPPWRRALPWVIATVALGVYVTLIANEFWAGIVCTGLALSVVFLSFTVVTGLGGLVSLAQASLVSIGGVTAGLLLSHEFPFPLALVGGGVAAVIFGLVVAAPSVRLSGLAFSLATLALAFIVDQVILQIKWFSGGISGRQLMRPSYLSNDRVYATVLFVIVLVVAWLVRNLNRSISGRAMGAVRSTEMGATASGISPARAKLGLFVVSSAIAGIGGVLLGSVNGQITPNSYPTAAGIIWLAVVVTFGVRRPAAAVLAGLAYAAAPQVISWFTTSTQIPTILFGLGAINLAASPDGSVDQIGRMLRALRDWIRRRRHPVAASTVSPPADPPPPVAAKPEVGLRPAAVDLTAAVETVLIADGVTAGYGASSVLRDVSLSLRRGSITAVLGANGAGKSTLCLAIAGIVPLTSGRLTMMGKDITRMSAHGRVKSGMILVPESRGIFPALTVRENLDVWLPKGSDAKDALERFPVLAKRSGASAGNLSGGEQQMLALAPLLFRPPDLLIVDEPSLGLAPRIVSEVFALFEELRTRGCALLIVEEKTTDALRVADEVIIIEAGAVSFAGAPASLDENSVASAYLGIAAPRVEHR